MSIIIYSDTVVKFSPLPVCLPCDELLTIEHMLLFGSDLIDIRERYFTARTDRHGGLVVKASAS